MIIRVWGVVNSTEVEFTPIPNRPGYWEGYRPATAGTAGDRDLGGV